MPRYTDYTRERLQRLVPTLWSLVWADRQPADEVLVCGPVDRLTYAQAKTLRDFRPARLGESFGPPWSTHWFKVRATVPPKWKGERVDLLWNSHSEAMLWLNGRSVQGLNFEPTGADGAARTDAVLLAAASGGEVLQFEVEMACNHIFGQEVRSGDDAVPPPYPHSSPIVLDQCELGRFDPLAWTLANDFTVLQMLEAEKIEDKAWGGELLTRLNDFANVFNPADRSTWAAAREILQQLYTRRNGTKTFHLFACGHTHIDTAWLWPMAEAQRKCERTFSSVLTYMARYPKFRFVTSAAQHYDWIRERNPDLYARIREKVKEGRFIPVGGMWVEPDANLPSGESLVRQYLYGQRYFQREFGLLCEEGWLPDTFGYNGQLPQLMRLSGIRRFVTQKLSWNRFNKPETQTFIWEGIDGSEVLTHFPAGDTYNGHADVPQLRLAAREFKDTDRMASAMYLYGHGDGGGGPTPQMIETLQRLEDLQGMPSVHLDTPREFFEALEHAAPALDRLVGELYVEFHRGTYTSQAAVKQRNRRGELALRDAELLCALAHRLHDRPYPQEALEMSWKRLLTQQFHDILPGSSIGEVYLDAARIQQEVLRDVSALASDAASALGTSSEEGWLNTTAFHRREVVVNHAGHAQLVEAAPFARATPAVSSCPLRAEEKQGIYILENAFIHCALHASGALISLRHTGTDREALSGPSNLFSLFGDLPNRYDAWDVDPFHLEQEHPVGAATAAPQMTLEPLRASLHFQYKLGKHSTLHQEVRLNSDARRLEFHTTVDWQETHQALKVAFDVNVRAMNATYQMQYGCVERPTHYNSSFDFAKYEVPAHQWSDLSEPGYGVALLSDSKYGFSTHRQTMRLTLLRAPTYPDPQADRGKHHFAYALFPHAQGWREAGVIGEAMAFNSPLTHTLTGGLATAAFQVDQPNVILDHVKKAEDSSALILRFYEAHGARGKALLKVGIPFKRATWVDLLEREQGPAEKKGDGWVIPMTPFQIRTLKLD